MPSRATSTRVTVKYTGNKSKNSNSGSTSTVMPCNVCHGTGMQIKPYTNKKK